MADRGRRAFGEYLRTERTQRQIPLEEICTATKIPVCSLEWLEEGEWAELPAEVFVRGFVRSYARHLGLSEKETLRRYHEALQPAIDGPQRSMETAEEDEEREEIRDLDPSRRRFELAIFVIIVLILATITLSLLWHRGDNTNIQAGATPSVNPSSQSSSTDPPRLA